MKRSSESFYLYVPLIHQQTDLSRAGPSICGRFSAEEIRRDIPFTHHRSALYCAVLAPVVVFADPLPLAQLKQTGDANFLGSISGNLGREKLKLLVAISQPQQAGSQGLTLPAAKAGLPLYFWRSGG
jgi:hypothetical protein